MRDCLDSQTLSEYISTVVLDDNEKLLINEVLEAYRKSETKNLMWDPGPRTIGWDPKVGP